MPTPNAKKPVRYMDFISRKPSENSDPLASRPDARPTRRPRPIAKAPSVADQIPPKGAHIERSARRPASAPAKATKPESELTVKKDNERPLVSREPAASRDLYADAIDPNKAKPVTANKTPDDLAIKASAALSGNSKPAEKSSGGNKSPFLPNYNIDKRPLSNSVPAKKNDGQFEKLSYLGVSDQGHDSSHKNIYRRKAEESADDNSKNDAVKIVDNETEKHGMPVWLIIIITIILGAAVGAGVYFLLPQ